MVNLEDMSKEELLEIIRIKNELLKEQREELDAYRELVEELQLRLDMKYPFQGNGD